ncbi:expressed unknown protein [Seminavis robusta]|uniref:Uncharacterized protein n=1 Tax=Seminavis robusta TaxID=568900 RepID=A0A9N8HGJ3_9STRA|nr:expressed unknown protein [Seminavis robusta]|eukprot:Sro639_g179680.1 n/a (421) ;mRNA; f:328-1590
MSTPIGTGGNKLAQLTATTLLLITCQPTTSFVPQGHYHQGLLPIRRQTDPTRYNNNQRVSGANSSFGYLSDYHPSARTVLSLSTPLSDSEKTTPQKSDSSLINGYTLCWIATVTSWTAVANTALSRHPTPALQAAISIRHNCFTIAQALAFPIPIVTATFLALQQPANGDGSDTPKRQHLGMAMACLWTAAGVWWGPTFSVGYDLFSAYPMIRYGAPTVFSLVAFFCLAKYWKQQQQSDTDSSSSSIPQVASRMVHGCIQSFYALLNPSSSNASSSQQKEKTRAYALVTKGLFLLAILPQLVGFPTATIPTLLGKRLSRLASGFTLLGSVVAYCLFDEAASKEEESSTMKTLRRGLGLGAALHIALVWAKIIGFDGGGLLLPGRGLWKDYPSLVNASGAATALMMLTYSLIVFVCFSSSY